MGIGKEKTLAEISGCKLTFQVHVFRHILWRIPQWKRGNDDTIVISNWGMLRNVCCIIWNYKYMSWKTRKYFLIDFRKRVENLTIMTFNPVMTHSHLSLTLLTDGAKPSPLPPQIILETEDRSETGEAVSESSRQGPPNSCLTFWN